MSKYKTMTRSLSIYLPGHNPIFGEHLTTISIDDEAAGMFLVLEQDGKQIQIDPEEWPVLVAAAERLLNEIREHEVAE